MQSHTLRLIRQDGIFWDDRRALPDILPGFAEYHAFHAVPMETDWAVKKQLYSLIFSLSFFCNPSTGEDITTIL